MTAVYYLLLQDRISEAKKLYSAQLKKEFELQCDYIDCYVDLFDGR